MFAAAWALVFVGCASVSDTLEPQDGVSGNAGAVGVAVCEPGKSEACACEDGSDGAQTCSNDGSRWLECSCASQPGTAGAAGVGGTAGTSNTSGVAGTSSVGGSAGIGGSTSNAGSAGEGGSAGVSGSFGTAGEAGSAGASGSSGAAGVGNGCECSEGICCDGCNFRPTNFQCKTEHYIKKSCSTSQAWKCGDQTIYSEDSQTYLAAAGKQWCSGESAICDGQITETEGLKTRRCPVVEVGQTYYGQQCVGDYPNAECVPCP